MDNIIEDIITYIFGFIPILDNIKIIRLVSRQWRKLAEEVIRKHIAGLDKPSIEGLLRDLARNGAWAWIYYIIKSRGDVYEFSELIFKAAFGQRSSFEGDYNNHVAPNIARLCIDNYKRFKAIYNGIKGHNEEKAEVIVQYALAGQWDIFNNAHVINYSLVPYQLAKKIYSHGLISKLEEQNKFRLIKMLNAIVLYKDQNLLQAYRANIKITDEEIISYAETNETDLDNIAAYIFMHSKDFNPEWIFSDVLPVRYAIKRAKDDLNVIFHFNNKLAEKVIIKQLANPSVVMEMYEIEAIRDYIKWRMNDLAEKRIADDEFWVKYGPKMEGWICKICFGGDDDNECSSGDTLLTCAAHITENARDVVKMINHGWTKVESDSIFPEPYKPSVTSKI